MATVSSLQPTFWRTCRVLANHTRLKVLYLLFKEPGQTVSALAGRLELSLPVASQYLRALEARGLLVVRRVGRRVTYRPVSAPAQQTSFELIAALRRVFAQDGTPVETIFRAATAFTHPRRIKIFRALNSEGQSFAQLQAVTRISGRALRRHLKKLETRGFVGCGLGKYTVLPGGDGLGRKLARLAIG
jgi:DNA-binding transcriptional ArsR family regulator